MKKLFRPLALIALTLALMPSCSDNDNDSPYVDPNKGTSADSTVTAVVNGSTTDPIDYKTFTALKESESDTCYLKGYIVGYIPSLSSSDAVFQKADTCTIQTNILIAESASETDISNCIAVQLPTGKIRSAVNLKDNPKNLGQEIVLGGFKVSYFKMTGLKNVFYAQINGKEITTAATIGYDGENLTQTEVTLPYTEAFKTNKSGKFSFYNAKISDMNYIITYGSYGMTMTGSVSKVAHEVEAYAISPKIDLTEAEKPVISISQSAAYFESDVDEFVKIMISTDFDGEDPTKGNWQNLEVEFPTECLEKFISNTVKIDLSDYVGEKVNIAVYYYSTKEEAGTYEITDLMVYDDAQHTIVENQFDGTDNTSKTATSLNEEFTSTLGDFSIYDVKKYSDLNEHIWKADTYGATAVASKASESWLISPKVTLTADKEYLLTFTNYYKGTEKPSENFVAYVSDDYAGGDPSEATWTDLEMKFGEASKTNTVEIDLSEYSGKDVYIAFKYICTDEVMPTCEVQNLKLAEKITEPYVGYANNKNQTQTVIKINDGTYTNTLINKLGDFSIYDANRNVNLDTAIWSTTKYGACAVSTTISESWLISPKYDLTDVVKPEAIFTTYWKNSTSTENYKAYILVDFDGTNVTAAAKNGKEIKLTFGAVGKSLNDTVDLTDYAGKNVTIAFQYVSTESLKGTFQISNMTVLEAYTSKTPEEIEAERVASLENYMNTVALTKFDDIASVTSTTKVSFKGYIVGFYQSKAYFAIDATALKASSGLLISEDKNANTTDKCVCVQLPTGAVRTALNLLDNPGMLGKEVIVYGSREKFNGMEAGIKNTSYAIDVEALLDYGTRPSTSK